MRRVEVAWSSKLAAYVAGTVLAVGYLPLLAVVVSATNKDGLSFDQYEPTLEWFHLLFKDVRILRSLRVSLVAATISSLSSTLLGLGVAFGLRKIKKRGPLLAGFVLPSVTPDIVLGLGLALLYAALGFRLGFGTLILSHITFNLGLATVVLHSHVEELPEEFEEAAATLGAGWLASFLRVRLPLMRGGILTTLVLTFVFSFDDFLISFLTTGPGATTLPIRMYASLKFGFSYELSALATLLMAFSLVVIVFGSRRLRVTTFE